MNVSHVGPSRDVASVIFCIEKDFRVVQRNDPKFSDRSVWANRADPDQTAPRGAV